MRWERKTIIMKMKKWIDSQIGIEEAKAISESLKINSSLTELNLHGNINEMKWKRKEGEEMKGNEMNR